MGHLLNSVILTIVFALRVAPRLASRNAIVLGGIVYGLAVFVALWFGGVPLVHPVFLKLNARVFNVADIMWGATLALILAASRQVPLFTLRHAHV